MSRERRLGAEPLGIKDGRWFNFPKLSFYPRSRRPQPPRFVSLCSDGLQNAQHHTTLLSRRFFFEFFRRSSSSNLAMPYILGCRHDGPEAADSPGTPRLTPDSDSTGLREQKYLSWHTTTMQAKYFFSSNGQPFKPSRAGYQTRNFLWEHLSALGTNQL